MAQAKTGTGKTIGFVLPILQNILTQDPSLVKSQQRARYGERASDIRAIIISPTRELAEQIAAEAKKLTQDTGVIVQTAVGGTQKSFHLRQMKQEGCHILVGTPGRLNDILSDEYSGVRAPKLTALVLDEADRLLDQGFFPAIQEIQRNLPAREDVDRQTLMFSATVSQEVVQLARDLMKPDLHYVRTVQDNEEPTHERVPQKVVTVPSLENLLPCVLELCQREIAAAETRGSAQRPFKAIVYFPATAETTLAANIFFNIRKTGLPDPAERNEYRERRRDDRSSVPPSPSYGSSPLGRYTRVYEIHSRLSQAARTRAAEHFRNSETAILMSSDVTARGMDFPGVTHVIQVGLPSDRDTYIHRLGRTARAGKEGEGWLILPNTALNEARYRLGKLPLVRDSTFETATADFSNLVAGAPPPQLSDEAQKIFDAVKEAAVKLDSEQFRDTYMALIGTWQWNKNKEWVIRAMNRLATLQWGMSDPPQISHSLARKMGLLGIPGVKVAGGVGGGDYRRGGRGDDSARGRGGRDFGDRERKSNFGDRERKPAFGDRERRTDFGGRERRSDFGERSSGRDRDDRRAAFAGRDQRSSFEKEMDSNTRTEGRRFDGGGRDRRNDRGGFVPRNDRTDRRKAY